MSALPCLVLLERSAVVIVASGLHRAASTHLPSASPLPRPAPPSPQTKQASVDKQQFAVRLTAETGSLGKLLARCGWRVGGVLVSGCRRAGSCAAAFLAAAGVPTSLLFYPLLLTAARSFHAGLEEVTLIALPEGSGSARPVLLNSFIDPQKGEGGGRREEGGGGRAGSPQQAAACG